MAEKNPGVTPNIDFQKNYDFRYWSKKSLPSTTSAYVVNHFDQTSPGLGGNIPAPNQFPQRQAFQLRKILLSIEKASPAAFTKTELDKIAKFIAGTFFHLSLTNRKIFEIRASHLLRSPSTPTDAGTPTAAVYPASDVEKCVYGEIVLNVPVDFRLGETFVFKSETDPSSTDLSALAIEYSMCGFLTLEQ